MSSLRHGIPRGFQNHRTRNGGIYRAYCRGIVERHGGGPLPADVLPLLREAGRLAVDLERLAAALETAITARRRRDQARIRRQQTISRTQLLTFEQRLEERLAGRVRPGSSLLELLAAADTP